MHRCNIRVIAAAFSLLVAAPLAAQKPVTNRVTLPSTPAAAPIAGLGSPATSQLQLYTSMDSLAPAPQRVRVRRRAPGVTLMLVGAAGVITGLLIDESIVTVPSAAIGLFGLYLYLR